MTLRVVFWGNSESVLSSRHFQAILATGVNLVAVVDAPAKARNTSNPVSSGKLDFVRVAVESGIPSYSPTSPNLQDIVEELAALKPDIFLAVGYPLILKPSLLAVPSRLAVNFHASLLPNYRGKHPIFWALRAGDRWVGLTVHVMDPGIDTGAILYQVKVRTRRNDTVSSLYSRILERSATLVGRLFEDIERGRLTPQNQPDGEGSYFSSIREDDFALNWTWPAEKLRRFIVTTPGECFVKVKGYKVFFLNAETFVLNRRMDPGMLAWIGRTRAGIATGDGGLWCSRIRIGEQVQSLAGFCRRCRLSPGSSLD